MAGFIVLTMHYIYVIQNILNNKIYVGQTNNPKYRWWRHKNHVIKNDRQMVVYSAIKKYGISNFVFTVIENFESLDDCNEAEGFWIEFFESRKRNMGYNVAYGGSNKCLPDDIKNKISSSLKGRSVSPSTEFKLGHKINIGIKAHGSKLNDNDILEIRLLLKNNVLKKDIAKKYNVSKGTISAIVSGRTWKHVI